MILIRRVYFGLLTQTEYYDIEACLGIADGPEQGSFLFAIDGEVVDSLACMPNSARFMKHLIERNGKSQSPESLTTDPVMKMVPGLGMIACYWDSKANRLGLSVNNVPHDEMKKFEKSSEICRNSMENDFDGKLKQTSWLIFYGQLRVMVLASHYSKTKTTTFSVNKKCRKI